MDTTFFKRVNKISVTLVLLLFILSISGCDIFKSDGNSDDNQEEEEKIETTWYKGNLHAHSYWTDGYNYPEMILNWYKEEDYNFAAITGHNHIHAGDTTIVVDSTEDEIMYDRYLDQFGADWVEKEETGNSLNVNLKPYAEYSDKVNSDDFLAIRAEEIDYRDSDNPDSDGNRLLHVNAFNVQELIQPSSGGSTAEILQETVGKVQDQSQSQDVPMLAIINHPNLSTSISSEDLKQVKNARFFEVYNGHPNATNAGYVGLHSTDELWDEVLTDYILDNQELLYGVATDDSHHYNFDNGVSSEANLPGRGWIQVKAEELSADSIIEAMNDGDFYASTGVELSEVKFEDKTLSVNINGENGVSYTTKFIGTKSDAPDNTGVVLAEETGLEASYTLKDDDLYVRAKIISDKNKENASSNDEVEVAWVQPVTP